MNILKKNRIHIALTLCLALHSTPTLAEDPSPKPLETPQSCQAKGQFFVSDTNNSLHGTCVSNCVNVGIAKTGAFGTNNYYISSDGNSCHYPCPPAQKAIAGNGTSCVYPCDPDKIDWSQGWKCVFSPEPTETSESCKAKGLYFVSDMNNSLHGTCVSSCANVGFATTGLAGTNNYLISSDKSSCVAFCNPTERVKDATKGEDGVEVSGQCVLPANQAPVGEDILMIINYNHPHYKTIPFFKRTV